MQRSIPSSMGLPPLVALVPSRVPSSQKVKPRSAMLPSPAPCQEWSIHAISAAMPYGQGQLLFRRGCYTQAPTYPALGQLPK